MGETSMAAVADPVATPSPTARRGRGPWTGTAVAVVAVGLGLLVPLLTTDAFALGMLVDGSVLAFMAVGLGFLARRLGLISLGHVAFFGVAAYGTAIAATHWGWAPLPAFGFGIAAGSVTAVLMGLLVVRASGMAFLMLTLALGQALYQLAIQTVARPLTGGHDGLAVEFPRGSSFLGVSSSMLLRPSAFWPVCWVLLVLCAWGLWLLGRGRFGLLLEAIRENEERMRFSGFDTVRPRLVAFVVSGVVAAVGGALFALHSGFVSPDILGFLRAGDSLIAALVGGVGAVAGPIVGAFVYVFAQSWFANSGNLPLYTGLALVVVVMFLPGGFAGVVGRVAARLRRRGGADA